MRDDTASFSLLSTFTQRSYLTGLEKWYIIGAVTLGYGPAVVAAARRTFGVSRQYDIW